MELKGLSYRSSGTFLLNYKAILETIVTETQELGGVIICKSCTYLLSIYSVFIVLVILYSSL